MKVLIIGSGPTGLTLAASLAKFGIFPDIVDFKNGPNDQSKALAINPGAQAQLGFIFGKNSVGKNANIVEKVNVVFNNDIRLTKIDLGNLEWPCNSMLVQSQYDTEMDLLELAEEYGVKIKWRTRVTRIVEHDETVLVTLEDSDKLAIERQYDYVIGCEGKHSLVREAIGAIMTPVSYSMYLALADFKLDIELSEDSVHYYVYEDTFFVFVPLGGDIWRIVVKHNGNPTNGNHVNLIIDPVIEKFSRNIFCSDCLWFSQAPLYVSHANKLQTKRLFIAGDSAHLYSPIGGTGMNTGIMDAVNLAWKLAFVINGYARGNTLINSYQEERVPAIRENAVMTDRLTKLISRQLDEKKDTDQFLPKISNRDFMRNLFPLNISGFGFSYPVNSLSFDKASNHGIQSMNPNLSVILMHLSESIQTTGLYINVLQFADQDINMEILPCIKKTNLKGVRDVVVQWINDDTSDSSSFIETHYSKNYTNIAIHKKAWENLRQLGDLQILRPDGIVVFRGSIKEHDELVISMSRYLNYQFY